MEAEEIRGKKQYYVQLQSELKVEGLLPFGVSIIAETLIEVAAQLAELNETLRKLEAK